MKHLGGIQLDLRCLGAITSDERRNQVLAEMEEMDEQWTKAALYFAGESSAGRDDVCLHVDRHRPALLLAPHG